MDLGHTSTDFGRLAAEGEYYWGRWTLSGLAEVETVQLNAFSQSSFAPSTFFDVFRAAYYLTDNFMLSIGHSYVGDTHFLRLGSEYGFALGGGRMASLFSQGWIGERGDNGAVVGLRIYFGQHDKTLIERHRQDDPMLAELRQGCGLGYHINPNTGMCVMNGTLGAAGRCSPGQTRWYNPRNGVWYNCF